MHNLNNLLNDGGELVCLYSVVFRSGPSTRSRYLALSGAVHPLHWIFTFSDVFNYIKTGRCRLYVGYDRGRIVYVIFLWLYFYNKHGLYDGHWTFFQFNRRHCRRFKAKQILYSKYHMLLLGTIHAGGFHI